MKNVYKEKLIVKDTDIDFNLALPITQIIKYLQDTTFTHSDKCGLDHTNMIKLSNAFWVITKLKVKILGEIGQFDKIEIKTWTHEPTGVRIIRNFSISKNGKIVVLGSAEWCCLDWETRKLRKFNTIKYPKFKMAEKQKLDLEFSNLKDNTTEADLCYTRKVLSTDIDVNFHTNNLRYNFFALDCFSVEELSTMNILEYEIYFVNESKEKDEIAIYKKQIDDCYLIVGKTKEKIIFRSVLKFSKK